MFYSDDHEPMHIHVIKDGHEAKYNITPLEMVYNHGFKKNEIALIESVLIENEEVIVSHWKNYFKK
jgi:hypothetical protein